MHLTMSIGGENIQLLKSNSNQFFSRDDSTQFVFFKSILHHDHNMHENILKQIYLTIHLFAQKLTNIQKQILHLFCG